MSMESWSAPPWSRRWSAATMSRLFWVRCASPLEKVACGAFSDISFVSAGKKRRFCQLRSRTLEDAVKRVYRAASLLQVAHARNVLITAGIRCELRNQYLAGALGDLPMMETWPQLYVDDDDETLALRALARAAAAPVGTMWTCSGCGEQLEPQFTQCWRCGTAGPPRGV